MRTRRPGGWFSVAAALLLNVAINVEGQAPAPAPRLYNTVKQKLAEGKQVVGGTVLLPDPDLYCAMANAAFDFTWIEMQHSPLTYQDVARMIGHCRSAAAIPFIRVPDATEGDIQKATDVGALGIILPMVDTVEKIAAAVKFARYPPAGRRSQGSGQYGALWGSDYRATANDNMMIVAMIENPAGVDIVDRIAAVPGVDVVFVASTDLSSFSGMKQNDPKYEALVTKVLETTTKAGLKVGGPLAWKDSRKGYAFFQGPNEAALIRCGARVSLNVKPSGCPTTGIAAIEGSEK
jgi:4-hydroxy-2-oxoheptanedioate aldolase